MQAHLTECTTCRQRLANVLELDVWQESALLLTAGPGAGGAAAALVPYGPRRRWQAWWRRPAWRYAAVGALFVAFAGGLAMTGQRAWADVLQLFHADRLQSVGISANDMRRIDNILTQGGRVSLNRYGSVTTQSAIAPKPSTLAAYAGQSGLPGLWPKALGAGKGIQVHTFTPGEFVFTLNVPHINGLIQSIGGQTLFPADLNGVPITVNVPAAVQIQDPAPAGTRGPSYELDEAQMPTVATQGGVDVAQARSALLSLPFLPQSISQALAGVQNFQDTLVVPVPGQPTKNIRFLGHDAFLTWAPNGTRATVVWLQQGTVAAFTESGASGLTPNAFVRQAQGYFQ